MRVTRRGLYLRVAQQLPDHGQALTGRHGRGREGVAKIVDPDILDAGASPDALPERLQIAERLARQGAGNNPRITLDALRITQILDRGVAKVDNLFT